MYSTVNSAVNPHSSASNRSPCCAFTLLTLSTRTTATLTRIATISH